MRLRQRTLAHPDESRSAAMAGLRIAAMLIFSLTLGSAHAADEPTVHAGVQCGFASGRAFPFTAGRDRCWEPINGKTMVPKSTLACAVQRSDGVLNVTFHFSESAKPECDNGKPATKEQYGRALPLLGKKEREFFLSHVDSK